MGKPSILFPCLIALFLITFGTGFRDACVDECKSDTDCQNIKCINPTCLRGCNAGCCYCHCDEASRQNVSPTIHLNKV
ncbi:hypothetical protein VNO80_30005 [Phaseolus coccineus]|uniref:Uncharacterized protein n=1 Tax=Phaseolus coccineus TaxID=3886 RepID=A0AAN9LBZ7_PHACN